MKARRDPTEIGVDEFGIPVVGTYIWYLLHVVLRVHEFEKCSRFFFLFNAADLKINCTM
jgi:hypothetical protein